jgi:hypothetical protein
LKKEEKKNRGRSLDTTPYFFSASGLLLMLFLFSVFLIRIASFEIQTLPAKYCSLAAEDLSYKVQTVADSFIQILRTTSDLKSMECVSNACHRLQLQDQSLTLLNLSCRGVGSEGVVKLSKSCGCGSENNTDDHPRCTKSDGSPLVALWLEGNEIYPSGAKALSNLLRLSPRLKYLYMSNNHIGNAGVSVLAPVAFSQCTVCHLGDNKIDATGAESIALALQDQRSQIQNLVLDNNLLGNNGVMEIVEALKDNITLNTLDLRYNKIGLGGLEAVRDMLKREENTTLKYFMFEEENDDLSQREGDDNDKRCTRRAPRRRNRKTPRLMEKQTCSCQMCKTRHEIEFYLALNRAGRGAFGDTSIKPSLWQRIMAKASKDDPSLLFHMLCRRPDVAMRR